MDRIAIAPIILRNQRPTDIKDCYIELFDDHLHYKVEFYADEPIINDDPDSGWEQSYNNFDIYTFKKNIAGIEKSFTKDKKWGVYIVINGFQNDMRIYSKSQTTASALFDQLQKWLFNG